MGAHQQAELRRRQVVPFPQQPEDCIGQAQWKLLGQCRLGERSLPDQ